MPNKTTLVLVLIIALLAFNNLRVWKAPSVTAADQELSRLQKDLTSLRHEKSNLVREMRFFNYLYLTVDITHSTSNIQYKDAEIAQLAKTLETPENMYQFVSEKIKYLSFQPVHKGALETLKAGQGDCVDQAELLASLLRAGGYPSEDVHVVLGTVNEKRYMEGVPPESHAWVEFNYRGKRMVLDPTNYLGRFEFGKWTRDDFYNAFKVDDYFTYNDKSSWIVRKYDNRFLE